MDKLDTIFDMQKKFDDTVVKLRNLQNISADQWIQKETLALLSELAELIAEVNFKWWKNEKVIDWANVKGELIDVLHFFVSMCLKVGMTSDELFSLYIDKNKENFDRQYGKSQKQGYDASQAQHLTNSTEDEED